MWTPEHRRAADRSGIRYPSDLTDAEWMIVAPMIPPARHGGRKRSVIRHKCPVYRAVAAALILAVPAAKRLARREVRRVISQHD